MKIKAGLILSIAVFTILSIIFNFKKINFYFIDGYTENKAIEINWNSLIRQNTCLTGSQDYDPEVEYYLREGSAFTGNDWIAFLKSSRSLINPFLLSKIKNTRKTAVHVCPHENALEGELAVYCLQHINKINRDKLDHNPIYEKYVSGKQNYPAGQINNDEDISRQKKLQLIITSPKRLRKFLLNWEIYISYHTPN